MAQQQSAQPMQEALQTAIDEERGHIDRKHGQTCGYSGPATPAYLRGYGEDHAAFARMRAQHEYANAHLERGWHT